MVTYRFSRTGLRVRISALHPLLLLVVGFLLSTSVLAADGLPSEPGSLVYTLQDDTTLYNIDEISPFAVDPILGTYFGNMFRGSMYEKLCTRWGNYTPASKDTQALAFQVFDLCIGIQREIDAVEASVDVIQTAENDIYAATQISKGVNTIQTNTPNLLGLVTQNQKSMYDAIFPKLFATGNVMSFWDGNVGNGGKGLSVADALSYISHSEASIGKILYDETQSNQIAFRSFDAYNNLGSTWDVMGTNLSVSSLLSLITENQLRQDLLSRVIFTSGRGSIPMLFSDGSTIESGTYRTLTSITANGFTGLAQLFAGNSGIRTIDVTYRDPSNPLSDGVTYKFPDFFSYLSSYSTEMGTLLAKLQFVLASDQDIEMSQQEQPNKDAVYDEFFGDGQGSVKPSDISGAAGLTSGAKDIFQSAGSADDAFNAATDETNYWFFSQEVANDLDAVGAPQAVSDQDDSWLDDYVVGEDGFLSLKDPSPFDVESYLEGFH